MGECRIRFLEPSEGTTTPVTLAEMLAGVWSSDTTVYDCFRSVKTNSTRTSTSTAKTGTGGRCDENRNLWASMADHRVVSIWDCTKYPPANITELCFTSGKEMTLYAAGWFPSGTIQVLPADADSIVLASANAYQDFQFNQEQTRLNPKESVKLIGKTFDTDNCNSADGKIRASQVLDVIPVRFQLQNIDEEEADREQMTVDAIRLRQKNKLKRRAVETERARKLDERIQKLNALATSKTSQQVRRMLIKSRATGKQTLREEDRVYLHVCFDDGRKNDDHGDGDGQNESKEDYRFFSLQDTVGAALASFQTRSHSSICEMLVSMDGSYYRLPSSLRFLDAIERKAVVPEVSTVVVRFFDEGEATTSIDERVAAAEEEGCPAHVAPDKDTSFGFDSRAIPHEGALPKIPTTDAVAEITASLDSKASLLAKLCDMYPKPAKKHSPALIKVQQMKIKGKATGDPKRVKSVDDRYFFELVIASSQNDWQPIRKGPVYYALTDPVDRCCADTRELQTVDGSWSVWLFAEERLQPIASSAQPSRSKSWQYLLQHGDVAQFSIIVWCLE